MSGYFKEGKVYSVTNYHDGSDTKIWAFVNEKCIELSPPPLKPYPSFGFNGDCIREIGDVKDEPYKTMLEGKE